MTELEYVNFIKEETDLDREADLYSLEHYGIPGMRWGIRRTPAQLGHKESGKKKKKSPGVISKLKKSVKKKRAKAKKVQVKKKEESAEELKKKVLTSNDPKFIYQHMNLLDSKELQDRIDRITKENRMKELATPKKKDAIKTAEDFLKSTASMAESVTKIYNAYNVVTGKGKQKQNQQQDKSKPNADKPDKSKQNEDSKGKDKDKNKDKPKKTLDSKLNEMEGQRNVSKALNDIMNDPAIKAFMDMPAATKEDWSNINKKHRAIGIRGQKWIHNS